MNNQFSQRVSDIITYSKEEANRLRNRYIGPEHLLLGMLRDGGGKAIEILMKLDIDLKQVKKRIESFLRDAEDDTLLPDADVPLSPMAAKILKMCILEARILKSATADAEHVLLAILKDGDNLAATVLEENRVNYQAVFEQLTMQSTNPNAGMGFPEEEEEDDEDMNMSHPSRNAGQGTASSAQTASKKSSNDTPVLDNFGTDMTRAAEEGKLDPVVGREREIERLAQILSRRKKNNPVLIGEPGVGKSTMLLQLCGAISNQHTVLYITGEESVRQVKLRAARLKVPQDNIYLAAENDVDEICGLIEKEKPELVVIDSIQTMRCMDISSSSGTVSQVKESAARLLAVAKKQEIPMFIVGHVKKDGAIAGPKVMEHIVDTVLYFEGDKMLPYRILRAAKNRYGSTNELGMFDMTGQGLEEIENPSQMLLEGRPLGVSGNCVACTMEGSRPILSEIQALATKTNFPAPRRACSGYDYNRMNLLIAVLEKRAGYFFGNLDVYINIVSGITLRDTACDLAVCLSMVSSLLDCPVSDKLIAIGEVGLGGEVRSVPNLEQRLREAERIGFERAVVPKHSLAHLNAADYPGMKLVGAAYISDAIHALKSDRL